MSGSANAFQNALDDFKQKLSLPLGTDLRLDFNVLEQLDEIGLPPVAVSDEVGYYLAITNRLDFLNVIDRFEDSKRKVKVARQDLLPSLSLIGNGTMYMGEHERRFSLVVKPLRSSVLCWW